MPVRVRSVVGLGLALLLAGAPGALADKKQKPPKGNKDGGASVTVTFTTEQRGAAQGWYVEIRPRQVPAGPREEGERLPPPGPGEEALRGRAAPRPGCHVRPGSPELSVRIGGPPEGYLYVTLDGDLVKLAVGTLLVVDAIDGLID